MLWAARFFLGLCLSGRKEAARMNRSTLRGALVGALVSGAIVAAFYELRVPPAQPLEATTETRPPLQRESLNRTASPAAAGSSAPGTEKSAERGAPESMPRAPGSNAAPATNEELKVKVAKLEERVRELETRLAGQEPKGGRPWQRDPPREELLELAKKCALKWDLPQFGPKPSTILDEDAQALNLQPEQRKKLDEVLVAFNTSVTQQLRAIYTEATGDSGAGMAASSMISEITDKTDSLSQQRAYQSLARERAGLQPPADAARAIPFERMMRLLTTAGETVEKQMADAVSPDIARRLRESHGGFSSHHSSSYGCPPDSQ